VKNAAVVFASVFFLFAALAAMLYTERPALILKAEQVSLCEGARG